MAIQLQPCDPALQHELQIVAAALPAEVLPARVSKLCEEVGVKCGEHPTWEEMPKLLKEVAAAVGMDL